MAALGIFFSLIAERRLGIIDRLVTIQQEMEPLFPIRIGWYATGDISKPENNTELDAVRNRILGGLMPQWRGEPDDAERSGEAIIVSLISLVHHYPFARGLEPTEDGRYIFVKKPLMQDESADAYIKWARDIQMALQAAAHAEENYGTIILHSVEAFQRKLDGPYPHLANVRKIVQGLERKRDQLKREVLEIKSLKTAAEYSDDDRRKFRELELITERARDERDMAGRDYVKALADIFDQFKKARSKIPDIAVELHRYDYYEKKPQWSYKIFLVVSVVITIGPGILVPMCQMMLGRVPISRRRAYFHYGILPFLGNATTAVMAYLIALL
jgi:hypothetical protein